MPINIQLPDGSERELADGATAYDLAESISPNLAKVVLAAKVNGQIHDFHTPLPDKADVLLLKSGTEEALEVQRHSGAHILAGAVKRIFGSDVRFGIGPAIADGFYYDLELPRKISDDDLPKIEAEMRKIIEEDVPFTREDLPKSEVIGRMKEMGQNYKLEILEGIGGETASLYQDGDFIDLCEGPHVPSTGKVGAFQLDRITGAYWRGDARNRMLTRIYGLMFANKKDLKKFLHQREEAKKRDHRKLGKELDLFSVHDEAGAGFIHWHPRGTTLRMLVEDKWKEMHLDRDYELVMTPHVVSEEIYRRTGHLQAYQDVMFPGMEEDGQAFRVRPMNCPGHAMIYKTRTRSYRDLPLRYAELGTVYRYEKSGVLHGLMRVRGFTIDDSHIFVEPDDAEREIVEVFHFGMEWLRSFGFDDFDIYLSTRPDKYVGEISDWDKATSALRTALEKTGVEFGLDEGGGAFYGPKIDVKVKDSLGRLWQCMTIQFDFNLPREERLDIEYTGRDNSPHRPYVVHRALMGSVERFLGVLIEHYGGDFPLWLAPVQVMVLPVTSDDAEFAQEVQKRLRKEGFRSEIDLSRERISYKIRSSTLQKIPYMLVVGARERESGAVAVRERKQGDQGQMILNDLLEKLRREIGVTQRNAAETATSG
jgi:threonyl-tRNA synthetase